MLVVAVGVLFAAARAAVGEARFAGFQFELFSTGDANFERG
jgi:hypothetical protein